MSEPTSAPQVTEAPTTPDTTSTDTAPVATSGQPSQAKAAEVVADAVQAEVKKRKLKIGGAEIEATADEILDDLEKAVPGGITNAAQLARLVRQKMAEVERERKSFERAADDLRDPRRALALFERIHGENAKAHFEHWYHQKMQEEQTPPEERERRQRETELQRRERALEEKEAAERKQREGTVVQQAQRELGRRFAAAAQATGLDAKADPHIIAEMAAPVEGSLAEGSPYTPEEAAALVKQKYDQQETKLRERMREMIKSDPAKLYELLGDDVAKAFRKHDVARLKAAQAQRSNGKFASPTPIARKAEPQAEKRKMTMAEYMASLRKK